MATDDSPFGFNSRRGDINQAAVIEHVKIATKQEQLAIKKMLIKVDFVNGDVVPYFEHLAKAIAI